MHLRRSYQFRSCCSMQCNSLKIQTHSHMHIMVVYIKSTEIDMLLVLLLLLIFFDYLHAHSCGACMVHVFVEAQLKHLVVGNTDVK